MQTVIVFDLSSTLIGVSVGIVDEVNKKIERVMTLPIKPERADGLLFGFTTRNKKPITLRSGEVIKTYLKEGEVLISKAEAKVRNALVKNDAHTYLLKDIAWKIGSLIKNVKPDVIVIERNESFRGVLTTKLLAEIAGGVYCLAGIMEKPMYSYNVTTVRALMNKLVRQNTFYNDAGEVIADTKMIFKEKNKVILEQLGLTVKGFDEASLDESDSLACLLYYFFHEIKGETL